jgi:hypothetical protein
MIAQKQGDFAKVPITALPPLPAERRMDDRRTHRMVAAAMVVGATAFTLIVNAGPIAATWRGHFADPDDAMRLVEVRAWLAGQGWFDMTALRLDPPDGSFMHWSRLVDMPIAAAISLFGLFLDPTASERLAAIVVPTIWLVVLYLGVLRLADLLVGRPGWLPALLGMALSGVTLVQFAPSRIGHHAPETVALVWAVSCAVAALDRRQAKQAAFCGALIALSWAMSLETLPFDVVLIGVLFGFWIWRGGNLARMLAALGVGLAVALPLFFLAEVGPARWGAAVCDSFGAAHLGVGLIVAAGAIVLALATPRLRSRGVRLVAATGVAALAGVYLALAYPSCLHDPFAGVDSLVRELWLSHVVESQPLLTFLGTRPMIGLAIVAPLLLGLAASLWAAARTSGPTTLGFVLVSAA